MSSGGFLIRSNVSHKPGHRLLSLAVPRQPRIFVANNFDILVYIYLAYL